MKRFCIYLLAISLYFLSAAAAAKIVINPPPDLPLGLATHNLKDLTAERNSLMQQYSETQGKIDQQAKNCSAVEQDSPKADECIAQATTVKAAVREYRMALEQFKLNIGNSQKAFKSESSYTVMPSSVQGEVYAVTADGHKIPIDEHRVLTIDTQTTIITGHNGRVQFLLPDETVFTIGPEGNMTMDSFVFDPKTNASAFIANIAKGSFRYVSAKIAPYKLDKILKVAMGTIGPRGTEFDLIVSDDGSGYVKLFSGELLITPKDGSSEFVLKGGQMVRFTHDKFKLPESIPASG